MRRFSWLGLRRRCLISYMAVESGSHQVHRFCRTFPPHPCIFPERSLHRCSFVIGKPDYTEITGLLVGKRYIHATGSCCYPARGYYEILGVSKNATRDEIKKAFYVLAKKYHPDSNKNNPSAKRKFQEIRDAYETLQDPEKRNQYDMSRGSESGGYHPDEAEEFRYHHGDADGFKNAHQAHFSHSFRKIFSEIFEDQTDHFASDIQVDLVLSFSEAANGCTKHLSFDAYVPCDSCHGSGYPLGAKTTVCPICRGIGTVTIPPFTTTCSTCKGSGQIVKDRCMSCRGYGAVEGVKEVKVTIPTGMDTEDTIRVPGAGNFGGPRSHSGSLYIKLKVADDPVFSRDGADVYVDYKISLTQAMLGGKVEVPTLSEKTQVKIPKGVQHGQLLVLRGKGLPKHGFLVDHGDQFVRFRINFPTEVNDRQRAILEEFAKEEMNEENSSSAEGNWWQALHESVMRPQLMLELSLLVFILLFVRKAMG
ncbi:chaperone protein dnaJ 1, mitochondrial-like isoform X2 [Tripterygium wilfordii]|uniref:chaperone protein dnaJ 1, mitochondrial-like isoform X2 n=1 Tax=Tripterygium wilfordii TaxID=458696 RepID=UPI0018F84845|nr:chaperone protein dnaJ 1, mitochondrial-like isoform X2 [Tripterygium wilfordii]